LYDEINIYSQKIKDLENQHKETQDEHSEDLEFRMREKQKLLKELEMLKEKKKEGNDASSVNKKDDYMNLIDNQHTEANSYDINEFRNMSNNVHKDSYNNINTINENYDSYNCTKKMMKKVSKNDVEDIGYELNCRMRIKRLKYEKVLEFLFVDATHGQHPDSLIS